MKILFTSKNTVYMMMKYIYVLSKIYTLITLLNYLILGKENDVSRILTQYNALSKNKKIVFVISFFTFWPFYTLSYFFKWFFIIQIYLVIFICLSLKIKIEKKTKNWNACNYSYSNLKIYEFISIIFTDGIINSYNTAFGNIYNLFSVKKNKDYKNILDHFAFLKSTGVSLNYLNFILNFTQKYKDEKIKKKIKIKIIIKIRRILNAIIMVINVNFREETVECGMRIIIENFKIRINNDKIHVAQSIIKSNKGFWKMGGHYIDKNNPKRIPHVFMMNSNGDMLGLTSSRYVRVLGNNCNIRTNECGLQPRGKTQYAVQFIKGEEFENRFELNNDFSRKLVKDFDIEYRDKFTGAEMQKSILISSQDISEALVKGVVITKTEKKIEKTINLNSEQVEILKRFSNKEMGVMCRENMSDQDLFDSQRRFYDKVMRPQSKDNYYDI
jgi:hypothetical protein